MSKTYIAVQSGGYYAYYAKEEGFMKSGECAVIEHSQFIKFMNTRKVTRPMFVSPHYGVCIQVAKELNESASAIELNNA
jgi:hypothetical protein